MNPLKTKPDVTACYVLALVFGSMTGYVEIMSGGLLLPVLLLIFFGCLLGLAHPSRATQFGLLLGLCIPAAHALAALVDYPYEAASFQTSFVAVLPALVGAYAGAFLGWAAERGKEF